MNKRSCRCDPVPASHAHQLSRMRIHRGHGDRGKGRCTRHLWRRCSFGDFCDSNWSLLLLSTMYLDQSNDGNLLRKLKSSWRLGRVSTLGETERGSILIALAGVGLCSSPWLSQSGGSISVIIFSVDLETKMVILCILCACVLLCPMGYAIMNHWHVWPLTLHKCAC